MKLQNAKTKLVYTVKKIRRFTDNLSWNCTEHVPFVQDPWINGTRESLFIRRFTDNLRWNDTEHVPFVQDPWIYGTRREYLLVRIFTDSFVTEHRSVWSRSVNIRNNKGILLVHQFILKCNGTVSVFWKKLVCGCVNYSPSQTQSMCEYSVSL